MKVVASLTSRLPYRFLVRLPRMIAVPALARRFPQRSNVVDTLTIAVDKHIRVGAYWLQFNNSSGPAVSIFFDDEELLRIDGLAREPHLHYSMNESRARLGQRRVELSVSSDHDMVERICFEIQHNVGYSLHLDRRRSVQRHTVDAAELESAVSSVRVHLLECVERHRIDGPPRQQEEEHSA